MLVSISQLSDLTGCARKTVSLRCEKLEAHQGKRNATLYESKEALPLILGAGGGDDNPEAVDVAKENALLAREKRRKTKIEREILEGTLIETEQVILTWQAMLSALRARLLALPTEAAQAALVATDLPEIEEKLRDIVYQALAELSDDGIPSDVKHRRNKTSSQSSSATTETDSDAMGRPVQKTKRGGKRKAGPVAH